MNKGEIYIARISGDDDFVVSGDIRGLCVHDIIRDKLKISEPEIAGIVERTRPRQLSFSPHFQWGLARGAMDPSAMPYDADTVGACRRQYNRATAGMVLWDLKNKKKDALAK